MQSIDNENVHCQMIDVYKPQMFEGMLGRNCEAFWVTILSIRPFIYYTFLPKTVMPLLQSIRYKFYYLNPLSPMTHKYVTLVHRNWNISRDMLLEVCKASGTEGVKLHAFANI